MLVGYNTNVPYKGIIYHVQTEDSGLKKPVIITLLYLKGTILASKKSDYAALASDPDCKEKVREMMKEQHKAMIKELIAGKHTAAAETPYSPQEENTAFKTPENSTNQQAGPRSQIKKSLDDILLDYIMKKNE
ncbi:MAG: hypothetical protein EHM54_00860 [Nitrospiraceae bacterium]|nr:MAG: hypothetical protein EHM54_00860 [Nitrospiraceae bacterium]